MDLDRRRRLGVAAAGLITFLNLYAPQALLPTLAADFGSDPAHAGIVVTATMLAVAVVAPFVGGISDALGRRRLIVTAGLLLVLPGVAMAYAPTLHALTLLRFVQGAMLPFVFTVTVAYIGDETSGPDAARTTSLYAISSIVAGFTGRFIAGWVTQYYGWRSGLLVLAALTLLCALALLAFLPAEQAFRPTRGWRGSLAGYADQFRNPQVMATCVTGFAMLFSTVAAFTFVTLQLAGPDFGYGPAALGNIFAVYLVGTAGTRMATRVALRWGRPRTFVLACIMAASGTLITLAPGLAPILIGLSVMVMGLFAEQVLSLGHIAATARVARSTAVGLYVTSFYAGGALGSIVPAPLWRAFGWPGPVALILLVQAGAALVAGLVWRRFAPISAPSLKDGPA